MDIKLFTGCSFEFIMYQKSSLNLKSKNTELKIFYKIIQVYRQLIKVKFKGTGY
jgi:hypothetical protein